MYNTFISTCMFVLGNFTKSGFHSCFGIEVNNANIYGKIKLRASQIQQV